MFDKIAAGVFNAATEFVDNAVNAIDSMTSIVGDWAYGDDIKKEDVARWIYDG